MQLAHVGEGHTKEELLSTEHTEVSQNNSVYPYLFGGVLVVIVIVAVGVVVSQKFFKK